MGTGATWPACPIFTSRNHEGRRRRSYAPLAFHPQIGKGSLDVIKKSDAVGIAGAVSLAVSGSEVGLAASGNPATAVVVAVSLAAGLTGAAGAIYAQERRDKRRKRAAAPPDTEVTSNDQEE